MILAPIALLGIIYSAVMNILHISSGSTVQLNALFTILVVGFSLIWLLAERIGNRNRFITFLLANLTYFGFLGVNLLIAGFSKDIINISYLAAISIPAIILAFIIAALNSPKQFNSARFSIYTGAALFSSLLIIFSLVIFVFYPIPNRPIISWITELLVASSSASLIYYAGLLPFLVLLFANPFWRKRFEAVTGIQTKIAMETPSPWE